MFALHFVKGTHPEIFKDNVSLFFSFRIFLFVVVQFCWALTLVCFRSGRSLLDPSQARYFQKRCYKLMCEKRSAQL